MYKYVRSVVASSHVMMYGDFRLGFDEIGNYIGNAKLVLNSVVNLNAVPSTTIHSKRVDEEKVSEVFLCEASVLNSIHKRHEIVYFTLL